MATAEGYLRRLTRRLTDDPEQLDVEELTEEAANTGAQKAVDCQRGQEVTMVGTLRSVETNGASPVSSLAAHCGCTGAWGSSRTAPRRSTTRTTRFRSEPGAIPVTRVR